MPYPDVSSLRQLLDRLKLYADLKHETGAPDVAAAIARVEEALRGATDEVRALPDDPGLAAREPSDLESIRALRPDGPRRLIDRFDINAYSPRLEGALLARCAGCILGSIVDGWSVDAMHHWARRIGDVFPPVDYWSRAHDPDRLRYNTSACRQYTRDEMDGVPVDDDLAYTVLGLLITEQFGAAFSTADVGRAWLEYLPMACTAEDAALRNLKNGIAAEHAAEKDNPFVHWIGADIRADPWGYLAPGRPEKAAEMAWRDAHLSHRRAGIHGSMLFAAAISAAMVLADPIEAIRVGLTEIPRDSALATDVRWALEAGPTIGDYEAARAAVDRRFAGMHSVHTNNNACLTIFGLFIGGTDVTRTIGQTVAMGLDNDCTAATAGSIVGAVVGRDGVPEHWHCRFHNSLHSYLIGHPRFAIDDLARRFAAQAERVVTGS